MEKANTRTQWHLSFTYYLIIAILLIIIPIIGLISLVDSADVYRETTANNVVLQNQTEQTIVLSVGLVDTGLKLFDDSLNRRMQDAFGLLIEEYERSGRNPETMNLPALKEQLGGDMDIYIINESGVIEYTTFEPDLGLDFSAYPDFYAYITDLRLGNDFSADRIVSEMSTGELRKYAYMPTPDHRYLMELGLVESEFKKARSTLKYKDIAARLVDLNPNMKCLRIFNWRGEQVTKEVVPDEAFRQSLVRQAYQQKQNCEFVNETADEKTRFIFINLKDPDYASDMSLIVELTYDTSLAAAKLQDLMDAHFKTALIAVLLAVGMAIVAAHIVTRPIRRIADDVDSIALGDLKHDISIAGGEEFARLGQSITTMVETLKAHIQRLEASEVRLREYSEHLEEKVRDRTADLQKSNEKANLYLDIMTHDISNSNNTANLYADLLLEELAGEPEEAYAQHVRSGLQKSIQIIQNVNTIRRIQESRLPLKEISLDQCIRAEIAHHPNAAIRYDGTTACVIADDLLSVIFTNLIGNAVKFGGADVVITIRVEDCGDEVRVSIEDTGPGTPDELKGLIFNRFKRGSSRASGSGLGLYICRMLIERYGGRIWVDDRIAGQPEEGTAFRFTLRRQQTTGEV